MVCFQRWVACSVAILAETSLSLPRIFLFFIINKIIYRIKVSKIITIKFWKKLHWWLANLKPLDTYKLQFILESTWQNQRSHGLAKTSCGCSGRPRVETDSFPVIRTLLFTSQHIESAIREISSEIDALKSCPTMIRTSRLVWTLPWMKVSNKCFIKIWKQKHWSVLQDRCIYRLNTVVHQPTAILRCTTFCLERNTSCSLSSE